MTPGTNSRAAVNRLRRLRDEIQGPVGRPPAPALCQSTAPQQQEMHRDQRQSSRQPPRPTLDGHVIHKVFGPGCDLRAPLVGQFGARLTGVDVRTKFSASQAQLLIQLFEAFKVLVIPSCSGNGVSLTDFERLANHFGHPTPHPSANTRVVGHQNVQLMSNVHDVVASSNDSEGRSAVVPSPYHTDLDYETEPASASLILCHAAPTVGAQTSFIDMEQAWDELESGTLREAASGLCVLRDGFSDVKPVAARNVSPVVRRHPRTGRTSLHVSHPDLMRQFFAVRNTESDVAVPDDVERRGYALGVASEACLWPAGEAAGRCTIRQLRKRVLRPARLRQCEYLHSHEPGCVVVWDNLSLMHTGPIAGRRVPRAELSLDLQQLACCNAVTPQSWTRMHQQAKDPVVGQKEHRQGASSEARILFRIGVKGPCSVSLPRRDSGTWVAQHIIPA